MFLVVKGFAANDGRSNPPWQVGGLGKDAAAVSIDGWTDQSSMKQQ